MKDTSEFLPGKEFEQTTAITGDLDVQAKIDRISRVIHDLLILSANLRSRQAITITVNVTGADLPDSWPLSV